MEEKTHTVTLELKDGDSWTWDESETEAKRIFEEIWQVLTEANKNRETFFMYDGIIAPMADVAKVELQESL
jgi:hypothetical protein